MSRRSANMNRVDEAVAALAAAITSLQAVETVLIAEPHAQAANMTAAVNAVEAAKAALETNAR